MTIALRPATADDVETIWRWRNDPATRAASLAQGAIPLGVHKGWYLAAVEDPDRTFFVGELDGQDIGYVRFDRERDIAMVSIALDPSMRGRRLAIPFLSAAMNGCPWPVRAFRAVVRAENAPSLAVFERCGFSVQKPGNPVYFQRENTGPELIIVLANGLHPDGAPNDQSAARLDLAAKIMAERPDAKLVTSGWPYARDPTQTIASLMADAAAARGVDRDRILESPRARDTVGDALFLAVDVIGSGPPPVHVTVVTSAYHAQRADEIFDFILRDIAPVTVRATNEPVTDAQRIAEASSTEAFHRTFNGLEPGDVSGILSTLHAHHPLYNGEVYGPDSPGVMPR